MINKDFYWPIGITVTLLLFVGFLVGSLLYSRTIPENLVTENYYENSIKYQQQIDRIKRSNEMIKGLEWQYHPAQKNVLIQLPQQAFSPSTSGTITLFRPSDAKKDRVIPLNIDQNGNQLLSVADLEKGFWRAFISWNNNEKEYYTEEMLVVQ